MSANPFSDAADDHRDATHRVRRAADAGERMIAELEAAGSAGEEAPEEMPGLADLRGAVAGARDAEEESAAAGRLADSLEDAGATLEDARDRALEELDSPAAQSDLDRSEVWRDVRRGVLERITPRLLDTPGHLLLDPVRETIEDLQTRHKTVTESANTLRDAAAAVHEAIESAARASGVPAVSE